MVDEDGVDSGEDALEEYDEEADGEHDACGAGELPLERAVYLVEALALVAEVLAVEVCGGEEGGHEEEPSDVYAEASRAGCQVDSGEGDDGHGLGEHVEDEDEGVRVGVDAGRADLQAIEVDVGDGEEGSVEEEKAHGHGGYRGERGFRHASRS